jgi:hypothetical protein
LNQTHSIQTLSLRYFSLSYLRSLGIFQDINRRKRDSNSYLLGLSTQLNLWNIERISKRSVDGYTQDLTLNDLHLLKEMINLAIRKSSVKYPEIISDQLLFLTVGAIQIQSQTSSDRAWILVKQSIQSYLNSQKVKRLFLLGLVTTICVLCLGAMAMANYKIHHAENPLQITKIESVTGITDPVTTSMLVLAYNKMKSGTCQLPQAAMLPPEQRQAFLMFINKGVIEVKNVENLRLALGYVNCLYPQELMHAESSIGNRL